MAIRARIHKKRAEKIELKESDNRFTPPSFVRAIEQSFGKIEFDPCWHPDCSIRPHAYLDVRRGDDGLRDKWSGALVFVNPPWSNQKKWIERAHRQWSNGNVKTVICLVPARTDTKFFHRILSQDADVYFVEGRPHFFKEDGSSQATSVSTMVVMFGATPTQKQQFATRVPGSWWMPNRPATDITKRCLGSTLGLVTRYPMMTCVAPSRAGFPYTSACKSQSATKNRSISLAETS